ncbi:MULTISPECIES: LURP-one-related/scramblase family protein [Corynebacterium]|uniref:LURP-one-related/scramblase family protein n=1 Tax=Corynebacterium TaxID=1716 RepID=UPI0012464058|nr:MULTISPECIES: phospholipid scramblase-related protein [Corynebacterium]KAA9220914.1 scramblase [Corynebacterium amycolatum]MBC6763855.1 scramblase [Corynebacterium sp. LK22]MDK6443654.1 phospholipid scramblase-related protein [Corynebacterium amycolatum]MDK8792758.1 phospholipid scramblase-related protein [Corynebacterium sp. MSK032]
MTSYWDNPKSLWNQIPQNDAEDTSAQQPSTPEQPPAPEQLPPQQGHYQGLLSHNTIVIQQIRNFMADDFDILDTEGNCIGKIETTGGTLSRMFMGSRRLTVSEPDRTPVFVITDPTDFALDSYEVYYPDPQATSPEGKQQGGAESSRLLATIQQKFAIFKRRLEISIPGFANCEVDGDVWHYDATFNINDIKVAEMSRKWSGFANLLSGNDRYVLQLKDDLPPQLRAAIIGAAIALDLMAKKAQSD